MKGEGKNGSALLKKCKGRLLPANVMCLNGVMAYAGNHYHIDNPNF